MGIGLKTKLSALTHSSLMFIDEETGGSEQGIVSSEWCPLIEKGLFVFSPDGWSSFEKGLMVH